MLVGPMLVESLRDERSGAILRCRLKDVKSIMLSKLCSFSLGNQRCLTCLCLFGVVGCGTLARIAMEQQCFPTVRGQELLGVVQLLEKKRRAADGSTQPSEGL